MITQGTGALKPRSSVSIRSPMGCLAERQGRVIAPDKTPVRGRERGTLTLYFPPAVNEHLEIAADKRGLTVEEIAFSILGGVVTRGSISQALALWGDYAGDTRCIGNETKKKQRRKAANQLRDGDVQA
jgi:hypothetical protein